jgi:hypothetical protein
MDIQYFMFVYFQLNVLAHSASAFFEDFRYSSQVPLEYQYVCIRQSVSVSQSITIFVVTAVIALYFALSNLFVISLVLSVSLIQNLNKSKYDANFLNLTAALDFTYQRHTSSCTFTRWLIQDFYTLYSTFWSFYVHQIQ